MITKIISPYLILLVCLTSQVQAQNISGVYSGDFISTRNVFVIELADTVVSGFIYIDQFERYDFQGVFSNNQLRGYFLKSNNYKVVTGNLLNDSLALDLISDDGTSIAKHAVFVRVSKNSKYNINKLYSQETREFDSNLIGKWTQLKIVDSEGKDLPNNNYTIEFYANGKTLLGGSNVDRLMNDAAAHNILLPSHDWETKGNKIIYKRINHTSIQYPGEDETVYRYKFMGDTLIVINPKGTEYFLRK